VLLEGVPASRGPERRVKGTRWLLVQMCVKYRGASLEKMQNAILGRVLDFLTYPPHLYYNQEPLNTRTVDFFEKLLCNQNFAFQKNISLKQNHVKLTHTQFENY
jgi:hypothetical protein